MVQWKRKPILEVAKLHFYDFLEGGVFKFFFVGFSNPGASLPLNSETTGDKTGDRKG